MMMKKNISNSLKWKERTWSSLEGARNENSASCLVATLTIDRPHIGESPGSSMTQCFITTNWTTMTSRPKPKLSPRPPASKPSATYMHPSWTHGLQSFKLPTLLLPSTLHHHEKDVRSGGPPLEHEKLPSHTIFNHRIPPFPSQTSQDPTK